jgi:hypothetical protein
LWSSFWEKVSLLLTGTTLDSLLAPSSAPSETSRPRSDSDVARELQAGFDNPTPREAVPAQTRPRSDSDIARQMQEEWNSPGGGTNGKRRFVSATVAAVVCMIVV